jgi:putative PIN family toxin of toxin-antitoxin system
MIPVRSKYRPSWDAFLNEKYIMCVTNDIISEYFEILSQKVSRQFAENIVQAILKNNNVKRFDPYYHFNLVTADPDDNKFVDCAVIANADYLVSEDSHFKILESIQFPKVNVITLEQFQNDLQLNNNV